MGMLRTRYTGKTHANVLSAIKEPRIITRPDLSSFVLRKMHAFVAWGVGKVLGLEYHHSLCKEPPTRSVNQYIDQEVQCHQDDTCGLHIPGAGIYPSDEPVYALITMLLMVNTGHSTAPYS